MLIPSNIDLIYPQKEGIEFNFFNKGVDMIPDMVETGMETGLEWAANGAKMGMNEKTQLPVKLLTKALPIVFGQFITNEINESKTKDQK